MTKVGSWNEHNKGLRAFIECLRLGTDDEVSICPALKHSKSSLWPSVSWEQGLLFHDKTPFRVLPKLCYGLGSGNCILCLKALMFIWNGYVQVCLMLYSLRITKLHSWIINFVSPLEAVPECSFQSADLRALQWLTIFPSTTWGHHHPNTKTWQRCHKKRKLLANITDEHRCKNPQQNSSNQNPTTH